ncbi:hypothetical protein LCGC14_1204190 [marine sediment metagenome]|uniref:Uncharacterized protein n=1 Tax=marine sediment metagenome TaxID=412755 RepID=A0A0F9LKD2_9ZZZZ
MATKKFKIKCGQVYNVLPALRRLAEEPLDVKSAYWLSKLFRKVTTEYDDINKQRTELLEKFAIKQTDDDKKNGQYRFKPEDQEKINKVIEELMDIEISLDVPKIAWVALENVKVSARDMLLLEDFVDGAPE